MDLGELQIILPNTQEFAVAKFTVEESNSKLERNFQACNSNQLLQAFFLQTLLCLR
jgi:hypothetical protein